MLKVEEHIRVCRERAIQNFPVFTNEIDGLDIEKGVLKRNFNDNSNAVSINDDVVFDVRLL